jgi:hypothetical protein
MSKVYWTMAVLLLSAVWAAAQSGPATTSQSQAQTAQPTTPPSGHDNETIEGCLRGSGNNFTLTDSATGKVYTLTGEVATLGDHEGQEVRLTGSTGEAAPAAPGTPAAAGASSATATFNVRKAKTIAESCKPRS